MKAKNQFNLIKGIVVLLVIVGTAFVVINQTFPPDALPASAPATEFSAERAIEHIKAITEGGGVRIVGTPAFESARDYLIDELTELGLRLEIQKTRVDPRPNSPDKPVDVENILTRIEGTESEDSILLVAHLDSIGGPGASDDANGVAVLLETARALLAGPPLRNTIIFLFTAPEETGYLDVLCFITEHRWAADVELVINIDAGGLSGPSLITNTSPENGWLIKEYAKADPYAMGTSAVVISESSSDFNTFKEYGYSGYAIDYSFDRRIHTPLDNIENLNPSSIQHQGYHALSLVSHFGNLVSIVDPKDPNPIYFNVMRLMLVHYPASWVIPIMVMVALVFAGVLVLGVRRKHLTFSGIGLGTLVFAICLLTTAMVIRLLWAMLSSSVPMYLGHAVNEPLLGIVFASITFILTAMGYYLIKRFRNVSLPNLTMGALASVFGVMVIISIVLPEISYGVTWPLFFSLFAVGYWFYSMNEELESFSTLQITGLLVSTVVTIVLMLPGIVILFMGLETSVSFVAMVFLMLMLGLLIPQLHIITRPLSGLIHKFTHTS